jgi:hypothetical protein
MKRFVLIGMFSALGWLATGSPAQADGDIDWPLIGRVRPRPATEIEASNWSVGAETMDRDYTVYENWKFYLGPLGFKKARLQAGWAKTECRQGVYDCAWLDAIIFDMVEQGVEPWMCLCYGNPIYADGGGTRLGARIPQTSEALAAWERFVRHLVRRYGHVIDEWEVWNEPNHGQGNTPAIYANLLIRTAEAVREEQPQDRILAMSLAGVDWKFADAVLEILSGQDKLGLVDEVTYHPYSFNPDKSYEAVAKLRAVIAAHSDRIIIRQGENGAPSQRRRTKALRNHDWTELSQAKWALRRLLGDLGRDIPSSYFAIMDMKYPDEMNRKGLLHSRDDQTVAYAKPAYYALQNLATVFDATLMRLPDYRYDSDCEKSLSLFGYAHRSSQFQVVTLWLDAEVPSDRNAKTAVDLHLPAGRFRTPVYVDLREGKVYQIPSTHWEPQTAGWRFRAVPCYDSPILIADQSLIPLAPTTRN